MANAGRPSIQAPIGVPLHDGTMVSPQWQQWFSYISTSMVKMYKYDVSINVASVAANTTSEQSFTVAGVASNDVVLTIKPSHSAGLGIVNTRVSAKDTVNITFMNTTGSAIDPAAETYTFLVIKV